MGLIMKEGGRALGVEKKEEQGNRQNAAEKLNDESCHGGAGGSDLSAGAGDRPGRLVRRVRARLAGWFSLQ